MPIPIWVLACATVLQPIQWPDALCVSWGPHGARIPVTVRNLSDQPLDGEPVGLKVGEGLDELPIVGEPLAAIRVCDDRGVELLWGIDPANGGESGSPVVRAGDTLTVPVSCGPLETRHLFVYVDNPRAWPVPDKLPGGLRNGGFEEGARGVPHGWVAAQADPDHQMMWRRGDGRGGSACAVCMVAPGSEATWVNYRQEGVAVRGGAEYVLRGWVRAQNVEGTAGWFIHVHGDQPMLINEVMDAGPGSYDWRQVEYRFTAPESAKEATVGTVLHGSGTAWYDDVSLECVSGGPPLEISVSQRESLVLRRIAPAIAESGWFLDVVNTTSEPCDLLVTANLRPAELAWRRARGDFATPVHSVVGSPGGGVSVLPLGSLGADLLRVELPARTQASLPVTVVPGEGNEASAAERSAELAGLPANLVRGALMETPADREAWSGPTSEGSTASSMADLWVEGPLDSSCLRLRVPRETAPLWTGVRQLGIPVKPGRHYFYGGLARADDIGAPARLHAHVRDGSGAVLEYISTAPQLDPQCDWTWTWTVFQTPPAATEVDLHLTTNTWGTTYYDNIVLYEVTTPVDLRAAPDPSDELRVGVVEPIIKVFPDDVPPPTPDAALLQAARNEYEVLQVAVRLPEGVGSFAWAMEPLQGPGTSPRLERVERVGYVPVDAPSAYRRWTGAPYERKVATGPAGSDGWAGRWPDPLLPVEGPTVDVPSGETTCLWLTFYVPPDAGAGEHRTHLSISAGEQTTRVAVSFLVRNFALPPRTRTTAIYDLREGPLGPESLPLSDPAEREAWYRFMAEHRVCPDIPGPPPVFQYEGGHVTMDATEFDPWARLCLDELGMSAFYTPWFFYALGWAYRPSERFGLEPFTPEYEQAMREAYQLFIDYLTERGWRDRLIHYVSDEPHDWVPQVVEDLRWYCALFDTVAPDIPRYSSTWHPVEGLEGAITMWGIGHYGVYPVAEMEKRLAAGDRLLITTDGQMCIDTPYLAVERLLPHYAYHYGADGYEFWGVSWWTYDPFEFGWHAYIAQNDGVGETYYIRYPNGDGYLTYPGARYGVRGPLASIRLALVREGLEDGEYLRMLSDLLAQLGDRAAEVPGAAEALASAKELVPIPNAGGLHSSEVLPEPTKVAVIREQLATAIEGCQAALGGS